MATIKIKNLRLRTIVGINDDERVKGMAAWALGKIGGVQAREALKKFLVHSQSNVRDEVIHALEIL